MTKVSNYIFIFFLFFISCNSPKEIFVFPTQINELIARNLKAYTLPNKTSIIDIDTATPIEVFPELKIGSSGNITLGEPTSFVYQNDSLYIADMMNNHIAVASINSTQVSRVIGRNGQGPSEFNQPSHIYKNSQYIFVEDELNGRTQVFSPSFRYIGSIPTTSTIQGNGAANDSLLFVARQSTNRKYTLQGYKTAPPFRKTIDILPFLDPENPNLYGFNSSITNGGDQGFVAAYITLPFLFLFDQKGEYQNAILFKSKKIDALLNNNEESLSSLLKKERKPLTMIIGSIGDRLGTKVSISFSNKVAILSLMKNGRWKIETIYYLYKNDKASKDDVSNWVIVGNHKFIDQRTLLVSPFISSNDPYIYKFKL